MMEKTKRKLIANTLAEVMIALMIIGVVAGLTVPTLKKHTQRQEYATKLKKGLMTLEQSVDAAIIENGDIENGADVKWTLDELFVKYLRPELQLARDCGSNVAGCMSATAGASTAVTMLDGIAIGNNGYDFYVDVNGPDLPNLDGVDVFQFKFEKVDAIAGEPGSGDYKFVPQGRAADVMHAGWKITYW